MHNEAITFRLTVNYSNSEPASQFQCMRTGAYILVFTVSPRNRICQNG